LDLIHALTAPAFVGYSIACAIAIVVLAGFSEKSQGGQGSHKDLAWVSVDVGVCALAGKAEKLLRSTVCSSVYVRRFYSVVDQSHLYDAHNGRPASI
jgi:hypothetical protein